MIKPNELRIGNLVVKSDQIHSDSPQYGQITTVYVDKANVDYHYPLTWYKPIPLTEEWLLKFGFKKGITHTFDKDLLSISLPSDDALLWEKGRTYFNSWKILDAPKHVHQLQNLYFALTGEELTVKE